MRRKKLAPGQGDLFGGDETPPEPGKPAPGARPNPLGPYFDAIGAIVGKTAVTAARARVGRIAKDMAAAGVTPARVADLPDVIRRYAKWRTTLDVNTVQACWSWLVDPPKVNATEAASEIAAAVQAVKRNNGEAPF